MQHLGGYSVKYALNEPFKLSNPPLSYDEECVAVVQKRWISPTRHGCQSSFFQASFPLHHVSQYLKTKKWYLLFLCVSHVFNIYL